MVEATESVMKTSNLYLNIYRGTQSRRTRGDRGMPPRLTRPGSLSHLGYNPLNPLSASHASPLFTRTGGYGVGPRNHRACPLRDTARRAGSEHGRS